MRLKVKALFLALSLVSSSGCFRANFQHALTPRPVIVPGEKRVPVVLVRGFYSTDKFMSYLDKALRNSGVTEIRYPEFTSRLGGDGIDRMAEQIAEAVRKLKEETNSDKVDLVAYSFGALSARYYLQRLGGKDHIRKFVSIAGTHSGTLWSYVGYFQPGVRDMSLNSAIINDLDQDVDPFGETLVYSFYTPYDLVVIPYTSSILKNSTQVTAFPVAMHQHMVKDRHVLKEVCHVLQSSSHEEHGDELASRTDTSNNTTLLR